MARHLGAGSGAEERGHHMRHRVWVLGAPDPEMEMIEKLLRDSGETVVYATMPDGQRVRPETAYRCPVPEVPEGATVYAVECIDVLPDGWVRIDHHRRGDPGYGRPPEEFLPASSLGQVIAELARLGRLPPAPRQVGGGISSSMMDDGWDRGMPSWVPWQRGQLSAGTPGQWVLRGYRGLWAVAEAAEYPRHHRAVYVPTDIILAAAADHCLAAAYRGECPGVHPDELMRWRVEPRTLLLGYDAIAYAEQHGVRVCKYADPTEGAREDLTPDEARAIAAQDPSLIYLERANDACSESS
jgi:hypothetical protein